MDCKRVSLRRDNFRLYCWIGILRAISYPTVGANLEVNEEDPLRYRYNDHVQNNLYW